METTGNRIKKERIKKGLTQKELGSLCGMADSAIRRYENGHSIPKPDTLKRIADALGVFYLDLYGEEESKEIAKYIQSGIKLGLNYQVAEQRVDFLQPYIDKGYEFSETERQLVAIFNRFNPILQQKLITDFVRLTLNPENLKQKKAEEYPDDE